MKRVLILTASFGDGHNAAAQNVRDALEQISPDAQVTVLDLFDRGHRKFNRFACWAYRGMVRYTPKLYAGMFRLMDRAPWITDNGVRTERLQQALREVLEALQPDCVVSTYPSYGSLMEAVFPDASQRPFRLVTVITDSRSVISLWHRTPSDQFVVCDAPTAKVLEAAGVKAEKIQALGFPVSPRFATAKVQPPAPPGPGQAFRVLYVINTGKQKAGKAVDRLLEIPPVELTVVVGRSAELKRKLGKRVSQYAGRLQVLGWTNQMPELMLRSHLVVGKAGGAAVQEAMAARCPVIINQIIPGQEAGNAQLVEELGIGAVAETRQEVVRRVREALADDAAQWRRWRERLGQISRPDAALRIARLVLAECEKTRGVARRELVPADFAGLNVRQNVWPAAQLETAPTGNLLCDFHIHTNYSDGKLTLPDAVDFYGTRGFDCICLTDHWADPQRRNGEFSRLQAHALMPEQAEEYFAVIEREAERARRRYGMVVLAGLEFHKGDAEAEGAVHLLGIGLSCPINPWLNLRQTIERIHAQGGLAVAAHPRQQESRWPKPDALLWERQTEFAPLIDAWEIAQRKKLRTPPLARDLPVVAGSDFHKPKHIYSWKTLLHCPKDPAAIKECIRLNQAVSIMVYREEGWSGEAANAAPGGANGNENLKRGKRFLSFPS